MIENRVWYNCINPSDCREEEQCIPIVFSLSNHRFGAIFRHGHRYGIYDGEILIELTIWDYTWNGTDMTVTNIANYIMPNIKLYGNVVVSDDYFIVGGNAGVMGVRVYPDNSCVYTNIINSTLTHNFGVRIGKTDTNTKIFIK